MKEKHQYILESIKLEQELSKKKVQRIVDIYEEALVKKNG